jgi:hypothetical protein
MNETIKDSGKVTVKPVKTTAADCDHSTDCACEIPAENPEQSGAYPRWEFKPRQNPRWGTVTVEGLVVGRGQNKKVIPPDDVYKLAAMGCDLQEMADWFGINRETLKYNFTEYINKGRADLKHRLRRAQIKSALEGNSALLIWLGKQYLGQKENPDSADTDKILPWVE